MQSGGIGILFALCLVGSCVAHSQSFDNARESLIFVPATGSLPGAWMDHRQQAGFSIMEIDDTEATVAGAPYSATAVREVTRVLSDGSRIVNKTTGFLARDSQGRGLKEIRDQGPGDGKPLRIIDDPVAQATYLFTFSGRPMDKPLGARFSRNSNQKKSRFTGRHEEQSAESGKLKHESLGRQVLQGIAVEGERVTRVVPAGAEGDDQDVEITSETWISPALQIVMLSRENDPRFGQTVYRLVDVKRVEPDPSLFEIPPDYQKKFDELMQSKPSAEK